MVTSFAIRVVFVPWNVFVKPLLRTYEFKRKEALLMVMFALTVTSSPAIGCRPRLQIVASFQSPTFVATFAPGVNTNGAIATALLAGVPTAYSPGSSVSQTVEPTLMLGPHKGVIVMFVLATPAGSVTLVPAGEGT